MNISLGQCMSSTDVGVEKGGSWEERDEVQSRAALFMELIQFPSFR